jgi:hypothetical protein
MKYLPKISVRDLLWIILVIALGVGLWTERAKSREALRASRVREEYAAQKIESLKTAIDKRDKLYNYRLWLVQQSQIDLTAFGEASPPSY